MRTTETRIKNIATHPELKHLSLGQVSLEYSRHAIIRANQKRIKLKDTIDIYNNVVEAEYTRGRLTKVIVRVSYNNKYDMVLAIVQGGYVATVWLNRKTDTHKTLNKSRIHGRGV